MTISAGFCASDGVLICADRELTGTGIKVQSSKIFTVESPDAKAIFSLEGHFEFGVAAIQKCIHRIKSQPPGSINSNHDIEMLVEDEVTRQYRKHICTVPDPDSPSAYRILLAAWSNKHEGASLYSTWHGSIRTSQKKYICMGAGAYMGDPIIDAMFSSGMTLSHASIVASYAAARAKKHVEDVGGGTNIVSISHEGIMASIHPLDVRPIENVLEGYDMLTNILMVQLLTASDQSFEKCLNMSTTAMRDIRKNMGIDDATKTRKDNELRLLIDSIKSQAVQSNPQSTKADP